MSEQVHTVTDLPKPQNLRKFAKRTIVVATAATVVVAAFYLKSKSDQESNETNTPA